MERLADKRVCYLVFPGGEHITLERLSGRPWRDDAELRLASYSQGDEKLKPLQIRECLAGRR